MSRSSLTVAPLLLVLCLASAFAADPEASSQPVPAPQAGNNPHRSQDQRLHSCRLQAKRQRLGGQGREQFIARCLRNGAAIDAPATAVAPADSH